MIITKTPFRMSFFGGGTDLEEFFINNTGAVISTTFDKYCYVTVRHLPPFFDYSSHLTYSKMEYVCSYDEIEHPAIRNAMRMLDMHEIRLTYDSDLPARSGLGTSSSFAVGMLNAFHALKGEYVDKKTLADEAIYLERTLCKEAGGWQDQIAASYGGLNKIVFNKNGSYEVIPIIIHQDRKKQLNDSLVLFFTGFTRFSSEMHRLNSTCSESKQLHQKKLLTLVDEAQKVLEDSDRDLNDFGFLLDETWRIKRNTGKGITTDEIDQLYERGISAGALGGKLLGAGGGGFILFFVEPKNRNSLIDALKDKLYVPFEFEDGGTRVIHYTPEVYEPRGR